MRVPWTARRSNQSILKEINPGISLEGMKKLKFQYFGQLILCCPLLLLPPIPPSVRINSNDSTSSESTLCMRWPKYWSFSLSFSPSNEHSGLISCRMDCLDLLAVQRTLKSPLQYHSSKASILQYSAFFTVQRSRPYMTTGKTIALTR